MKRTRILSAGIHVQQVVVPVQQRSLNERLAGVDRSRLDEIPEPAVGKGLEQATQLLFTAVDRMVFYKQILNVAQGVFTIADHSAFGPLDVELQEFNPPRKIR